MSFVVSARKYRPRHFDELVGQDHIASTLSNALQNDKLAHAFLFAGPRGVGKTTSARILAKVLNCTDRQENNKSCNVCSSCKSFSNNASFNIFELDAASNNSVEHIRALNDQVRFQPQQGSYKIYIIDEVHMLSQAAFNAFLKTLEEPPPYAKFILATTEKHKIIPTILSRCQIFDFRRISVNDITAQLITIASKEERNLDQESLHLIAQKADGAMRDALSIYDKVVSSITGDIKYVEVAEILNVLDYDVYFKVVDHAIKEDLPGLMVLLDEIVKRGFEMEQFCLGFMEHLRQLLFVKDLQTAKLLETTDNLKERYLNQAQLVTTSFVLTALAIMEKTDLNLLRSQNKRLTLELALSRIAYMLRVDDKKKTPSLSQSNTKSNTEANTNSKAALAVKSDDTRKTTSQDTLRKNNDPAEDKASKPLVREKEESKELETVDEKPTKNDAALKSKDLQTSKSIKIAKAKVSPTVSVNIDDLVASIKKEEDQQRAIKNPFTEDHITQVVSSWKEKTDSKSLQTALNYFKIQIEEDIIVFKTPLEIYQDMIRQESGLMDQVREEYPLQDIKFRFEVDVEAFPNHQAPQKNAILSPAEKYEKLKAQNPAFGDLVKELNLKPNK